MLIFLVGTGVPTVKKKINNKVKRLRAKKRLFSYEIQYIANIARELKLPWLDQNRHGTIVTLPSRDLKLPRF